MDSLHAANIANDDGSVAEVTAPQSAPTATVVNASAVADAKGKSPEIIQADEINEEQEKDTYECSSDEDQIDYLEPDPAFLPQESDGEEDEEDEGEDDDEPSPKKQKNISELPKTGSSDGEMTEMPSLDDTITPEAQDEKQAAPSSKASKKSKKKNKDVWVSTSRKGKKKTKHASSSNSKAKNAADVSTEDKVLVAPVSRVPDRNDDSEKMQICLSKVYKAEKVELSEDRLTASSTKGFRMVRATRGVTDGAWYFEIKVEHLGESGHTRLGWSTEKGDLQAPVGYDGHSFGYRDIDGSKVHKALREKYGDEGYKEGDVLGFYINLPDGAAYAPNPPRLLLHRGQRFVSAPNVKDDPPKVVPGSEISFFKNGVCQGVAFTDLHGGRYYPAASMYTLPDVPPCVVKFNFGPDFERYPEDFGERPAPKPMIEVPYLGYDGAMETGGSSQSGVTRMCPGFNVLKEDSSKIMKADEMLD